MGSVCGVPPRKVSRYAGTDVRTLQSPSVNARRWAGRSSVRQSRRIHWQPPDRAATNLGRTIMHYSDATHVMGHATAEQLQRSASYFSQYRAELAAPLQAAWRPIQELPAESRATEMDGTGYRSQQPTQSYATSGDGAYVPQSYRAPTTSFPVVSSRKEMSQQSKDYIPLMTQAGGYSAVRNLTIHDRRGGLELPSHELRWTLISDGNQAPISSQSPQEHDETYYEAKPSHMSSMAISKGKEREPRYEGRFYDEAIDGPSTEHIWSRVLQRDTRNEADAYRISDATSRPQSTDVDEWYDPDEFHDSEEWLVGTAL
ncbi:hypothetical protein CC86DRAFT_113224 [Ophiobolus disseminans]|uniref:Uncharacterized protein n=1 Tax=Ophiobolus disseminans TaxID=1469910 RepID=A0A6A6ZJK4_9PLEO|nr:hypothetical protein CC86DRAFT_113224 [Ophiobolus disseminans]